MAPYQDGDSERSAGTFVRKADALVAAEEAERHLIASLDLSPSTVPAVYGTFQRMMAIALEEDLITKSPCTVSMQRMLPRRASTFLFSATNGSPLRQSSWRRWDPRQADPADRTSPAHPETHVAPALDLLGVPSRLDQQRHRDVYGHLFPESTRGVAEALDAAIEEEVSNRSRRARDR